MSNYICYKDYKVYAIDYRETERPTISIRNLATMQADEKISFVPVSKEGHIAKALGVRKH